MHVEIKKIALQLSACIVAGIACCGTALAQTYQGRVYYLNSSDDRPCYFAHVVYTVKDGVALPQAVGRWFAVKRSSVNYAEIKQMAILSRLLGDNVMVIVQSVAGVENTARSSTEIYLLQYLP